MNRLRRRIFGHLEHPNHLHLVGLGFGCSSGCTRQVCPCGRLRVDGIVHAEPSSHRSIRSVHFHDGEARILKLKGQTGPIGAGAFIHVVGWSQTPRSRRSFVVTLSSGGDWVFTELAAIGGQGDRHVNILVGVEADHDVRGSALAGLCQGC
jgi:hypothetical protein